MFVLFPTVDINQGHQNDWFSYEGLFEMCIKQITPKLEFMLDFLFLFF